MLHTPAPWPSRITVRGCTELETLKARPRKLSGGPVRQASSPFPALSPMPGPAGGDRDTPRALASSCFHSNFPFAATAKLPSAEPGPASHHCRVGAGGGGLGPLGLGSVRTWEEGLCQLLILYRLRKQRPTLQCQQR